MQAYHDMLDDWLACALRLLTFQDAFQHAAKTVGHKKCAVIKSLVLIALSFDMMAPRKNSSN